MKKCACKNLRERILLQVDNSRIEYLILFNPS